MSSCCSSFCAATERQFTSTVAERDLARYRRKGLDPSTRMLRDGLRGAGSLGTTLLDIGAGIGALTFELLKAGMVDAIAVDASPAYLAAGRQEAERQGRAAQVRLLQGDFVQLAPTLPVVDVVTMDRVVCCYPACEPLLEQAAGHADRLFALSYPRDRWYVRAVIALENLARRLTSNPFRAFVHPALSMESQVERSGFRRVARSHTLVWCADVYLRSDAA